MERINFAKPGVTTIVECLKYATTGEQPPNTKGGAFVHDPKMAHEKIVKAQVKLRFYARNGMRMTATRNLQVTATKTGQTMKTLESILDAENPNAGNKRTTISTRCAEIDVEIPNLLGVSKSVLDNVIFCHQEDSYWPLAEASVLKKKFDDIFEATKYTKALDNIKGIRKERVADLKAEKERLAGLASERKHADKLTDKISELTSTATDKEERISVLQEEAENISAANLQFYEQAMQFKEHYMKAEELENRRITDRDDARALEAALGKEAAGPDVTDAWLQEQVNTFQSSAEKKEKQVDEMRRQIEEEKGNEAAIRRKLRSVESQKGLLQGDAQRHDEDVAARQSLIERLGELHSLGTHSQMSLDEDAVHEFVYKLKSLQRKHGSEKEQAQNAINTKNREYTDKIARLRSEIETLKRERDATQSSITQFHTAIAHAESVIDRNKTLESEIKFNNDDLADKRARLDKMVSEFASAKFDDQIAAKTKLIQTVEVEREALYSEQTRSATQADERAKLDLKRADLKKKQAMVERILEAQATKFRNFFDVDAQAETMESDIDHLLSTRNREITRLENEYNKANRESAEAHSSHERLKKDLADKQKEVDDLVKKIHKAANAQSEVGVNVTLEQALEDAATELRYCQEEAGQIVGTGDFYKKLLEDGRKHKKCGVCDRGLVSSKEMSTFEQVLQEKIAQTTDEKIQANKEAQEMWSTELARLQQLLPLQGHLNKTRTDIPKLQKAVEDAAKKDEAGASSADKAAAALKDARSALADLNALREHARNVTRTNEEVNSLRTEVTQLERNLQTSGSVRTATDLQTDLDNISQKIKTINRDRQIIQTQKEQQLSAQRDVEKEIHSMEIKAGQLDAKLQEGRAAETKMENDKRELSVLRSKIPSFDTQESSLRAKIEELKSSQREEERRLGDKLSAAEEQFTVLNGSVLELDSIQSRIEKFTSENRAQRLQSCIQQAADLETQISGVIAELEAKRQRMAAAQTEIDQGGARLSNLQNNLHLRRLRKRIEETETELAALPMEEAANSKRTFDIKWGAMQKRESDIKEKISRLQGEVSTMQAQIDGHNKDLASDFKNIKKRYMDQLIKVKMSDMANNDLEKYAKALDSAIMKYHTLKMEEVNDIMRHLWNKTYQGTDIDGIMIRSEGDGGGTRKSYNYRVVMMKDQVEMDMRGRCSAGQKMLASIIIRLALSDSFAQDCGILALDEPTNALDVENIEALAASLVEIINERKRAANFQLIIITHDENFLRKLGENGVIQDYWRVTRSDSQKSIIEKHMLL
ncbi:DNA repair protein rad50 [Tulasnella sp. 424]|nr:DNA repair protein rad50 [Tulasnella sp. 424]